MGMALFYVTVFLFFSGCRDGRFCCVFGGVLGKVRVLMWCFAGEFVVNRVISVGRRHHVAWRLKTCHSFEIYFHVGCGKESGRATLGIVRRRIERGFAFDADLRFAADKVGDGFARQRKDVAMHEWMIGVGFIAILMTPCFIAMRHGAEDADDTRDDQESAGLPSARSLKLL
jgi:hypothetical protein